MDLLQWEREIFFTSLTGFHLNFSNLILIVTLKKIIYSRETHRERQREKQAPYGEPNVGLDTRIQDHDLSQRETLNHRTTQVPLIVTNHPGAPDSHV